MENKKYNLFLDDLRVPYISKEIAKEHNITGRNLHFSSAYEYTHYEPFKDEEWLIIRNYDDFVECIEKNGIPVKIAFDHDLADVHYKKESVIVYDDFDEKTGYHAAVMLCEHCEKNNIKFPEYIVISWNPTGRENIEQYIKNYINNIESI